VSVIIGFPVNRVPVNVALEHRTKNTIVRQVRTANVFLKKKHLRLLLIELYSKNTYGYRDVTKMAAYISLIITA
jgi:hypothetical protein